ncbi:unnamed protein product, partial [Ixodes hexagonus]
VEQSPATDPETGPSTTGEPQDISNEAAAPTSRLKREVGLASATALLIGAVIGSGIFVTPSTVFRNSGSIGVVLIVWFVSGVTSIIGGVWEGGYSASCILSAEHSGEVSGSTWRGEGVRVLQVQNSCCDVLQSQGCSRCCFGEHYSSRTNAIKSGSESPQYDINHNGVLTNLLFSALATLVNCISVKTSARVQDVLSSIKCLVLLSIIFTGAAFSFKENHLLDRPFFTTDTKAENVVFAFYGAIFSYGGWRQISHIAEEIKNPTRNIPLALFAGIFAITIIYMGTNVAYFVVLDAATIASTDAIAVSFAVATWGSIAATVIPICVAVSCFGTLCAGYFSSARVMLAAGRQGHLPLIFSFITVDTSLPLTSILLRGCLAFGYTFAGSVEVLIAGGVFLESLADVFIVLTLFVLRVTMKDAPRPYHVPTALAIFKLLVSVALIVLPFLRPVEYLQYIVMVSIGIVCCVYYVMFVRFRLVLPGSREATCVVQRLLMCVPCVNELELMLKEKL